EKDVDHDDRADVRHLAVDRDDRRQEVEGEAEEPAERAASAARGGDHHELARPAIIPQQSSVPGARATGCGPVRRNSTDLAPQLPSSPGDKCDKRRNAGGEMTLRVGLASVLVSAASLGAAALAV